MCASRNLLSLPHPGAVHRVVLWFLSPGSILSLPLKDLLNVTFLGFFKRKKVLSLFLARHLVTQGPPACCLQALGFQETETLHLFSPLARCPLETPCPHTLTCLVSCTFPEHIPGWYVICVQITLGDSWSADGCHEGHWVGNWEPQAPA